MDKGTIKENIYSYRIALRRSKKPKVQIRMGNKWRKIPKYLHPIVGIDLRMDDL